MEPLPATGRGWVTGAGAGLADALLVAGVALAAGAGLAGLAMSCGVSTDGGVTLQGCAEVLAAGVAAVPAAGIR